MCENRGNNAADTGDSLTGTRGREANDRRQRCGVLPGASQRLLSEAAEVLLSTDEPAAMLRGVFTKLTGPLGVDVYFNYMVNEAGDALRLESCHGVPEYDVPRLRRLEFGQAVCGTVALGRRPIVVGFVQQSLEPMVQLVKGYGIRAYACNPLLARGRLLGTLSFATRLRDVFEPVELDFFQTITRYAASAYERLALIRQLRQADRRKDEFLAMLGHELRNPVAAIATAVELAQWSGPEEFEPCMTVVDRQVRRLKHLLDDLLDVSRITRGKIPLRREKIDLPSVIDRSIEFVEPLFHERGHSLIRSQGSGATSVVADSTRLEQVFVNLLSNAAKYTEPGGRIEVTMRQEGDEVVATVADNGIGIPDDAMPAIFDMFSRRELVRDRNLGGLGIGLTLVDRIIRLHGGTVTVRSDGPGRGTEFEVRLPLALGDAARLVASG
ncbi:MAG: ATP-binding protein [Isosphaeraceae bacterium]